MGGAALVEISGVAGRTDFRNDGGGHGSSDQSLPVESFKPLVLANVGSAGLQVSKTLGSVGLQKPAANGVRNIDPK